MLFGKLFTNPKMWVNGDADEITMGGVYTCKDVQNVPTGDGALFVFKTENTVKQVFVPIGEEGVVYTRVLGDEWASVTGTSEETEALIQSAIDKANQAQAKANTVDTRLNNIIVESGTSDAEVVAARTDSSGQTFTTLGVRLDTQFSEKLTRKNKSITFNVSNVRFGSLQSSSKLITGVGLYNSFGIISTGANALLIEVTPGETVTIKPPVIDGVYFKRRTGFYNSSGSYIKQEALSDNMTITIAPSNCTRIAIALYAYNTSDNTEHSLQYELYKSPVCSLVYNNQYAKDNDYLTSEEVYNAISDNSENEAYKGLLNSRFITSDTATPLTILHFSDIHSDKAVISAIKSNISEYKELIQNIICTGDMVANTGGDISSWWYPDIMTCVGNHDSATKSGTVYDWNGVSMANREAYYITPYKDNWGDIVHTSGTSYYYKDYATEKVRLIVIDAMLYTGTTMETEATAQTAWIADALSGAISAGLHVLIATHAPHGGSTKIACSFSQNWPDTMPTQTDCNTPQSVIDAVAQAITNGLHFIGYLCGHTHRDEFWDATGDKSQLMYGITCANSTNKNQWIVGDLYRDINHNAYNLVTIDTTNTLIKIVRGGGADISNIMKARRGICINYTTGNIVGEVL